MDLNILVDKELKPFPICCLSTITRLHQACQSLCKVIFKQVQPNVNKKEFLMSWHPSKKIKNIQLIKHSDIFQKYFCSPHNSQTPCQASLIVHSCSASFQHGEIPPNSLQFLRLPTTFLSFVLLPNFSIYTQNWTFLDF